LPPRPKNQGCQGDRRDAGHFIEFTCVRHRIGSLRRRRHEHQVDIVLEDEVIRDLAGTIRRGLAVLEDDFDGHRLAAMEIARLELLLKAGNDPFIGFTKCRKRTGLRRHIADTDFLGLCEH
jgi:hypothetical protein